MSTTERSTKFNDRIDSHPRTVTRRTLLAGIGTTSLAMPCIATSLPFLYPETRSSIVFVDDPIATQGGELTFTIWRQLFYAGPAVVGYEVSIAEYLLDDAHARERPIYEGLIEFDYDELYKFVRLPTKKYSGSAPVSANIFIRAISGCRIAKNVGIGTVNPGIAYYFAENGSALALGTTPEQPLDYQSFPHLIEQCGPGTSLLFRRGDTFKSDRRFIFNGISGGTEKRPIIISAYGDGPNPIIKTASLKHAWWFRGTHIRNEETRHLVISDLDFVRTTEDAKLGTHLSFGDKSLFRPHDITITRCGFRSGGQARGALWSSSPKHDRRHGWLRNFKICFNSFNGATTYEISCAFDTFEIYSNRFNDGGERTLRDWAIYASHARNGRIEDNFIENWIQGIKLRASLNLSVSRNFITGHKRVGINIGGDLDQHGRPGIARQLRVDSNLIIGGLAILIMEQDNKPETKNPVHLNGLRCTNNIIILPKNDRFQFGVGIAHHSAKNVAFFHNTIIRCGAAPALRLPPKQALDNLDFKNNMVLDMSGSKMSGTISSSKSKWFDLDRFLAANIVYEPNSPKLGYANAKSKELLIRSHRHRYPEWDIISEIIRASSRYTRPMTKRDFWSNPRNSFSFFGAIELQDRRKTP